VIEYTCKKYGHRKIRTGDDGLDAHIAAEIDKEANKDIDPGVSACMHKHSMVFSATQRWKQPKSI
jgi:hypothetical protein